MAYQLQLHGWISAAALLLLSSGALPARANLVFEDTEARIAFGEAEDVVLFRTADSFLATDTSLVARGRDILSELDALQAPPAARTAALELAPVWTGPVPASASICCVDGIAASTASTVNSTSLYIVNHVEDRGSGNPGGVRFLEVDHQRPASLVYAESDATVLQPDLNMFEPDGICVRPNGELLVLDKELRQVYNIDPTDNSISTVLSTTADRRLRSCACDTANCYLSWIGRGSPNIHYITRFEAIGTGSQNVVLWINPSGLPGTRDGNGENFAQVNQPAGMAFDAAGNLFFAQSALAPDSRSRVRRVDAGTGVVSTIAVLDTPVVTALAVDSLSRVYVAKGRSESTLAMLEPQCPFGNGCAWTEIHLAGSGAGGVPEVGSATPALEAPLSLVTSVTLGRDCTIFVAHRAQSDGQLFVSKISAVPAPSFEENPILAGQECTALFFGRGPAWGSP